MSEQSREAKMQRKIMVVSSEFLYEEHSFEGFVSHSRYNFRERIHAGLELQQRGPMEEDPSYQQPIPYTIIWNPSTQKLIAYKRSSDSTVAGEDRLYGKWSIGVGGHIEESEGGHDDPVAITALKEIREEVHLDDISELSPLGYINDNSDPVGEVHFGIVFLAETTATEAQVNDGEIANVHFLSLDEVQQIIDSPTAEMESWSELAFEYLLDHLQTSGKKSYSNQKNR